MGEGESKLEQPGAEGPKKTPLDLAVKHFKYFDKACSIPVLKEKCQSHWVLLCPERVWWPREGTLFPGAIHRLCRFLEANQDKRCLPDDLIYAKGWLRLSENVRHKVKFKLLEWDARRAIKHMVKTKKSPCKDPAEATAIKQLAEETSERSNMLFSISPDQTDEQQLEEAWFEENVPQAPCEQLPPSPREKAEKVLNRDKQPEQQPPSFPPPMRDKGERDDKTPRLPERSTMPPPTFPSQSIELQFREAGKVLKVEKVAEKELKPRLAEGKKQFQRLTETTAHLPALHFEHRREGESVDGQPPGEQQEKEGQRDNGAKQKREREREQQSDVAQRPTPMKGRLCSCEARNHAPCPPPRTKRRKDAADGQQPSRDTNFKRREEGGEMSSFLSDTDVQPSSSETCPVKITAEIAPGAPGRQAETMNVQKVYDMTQESEEREAGKECQKQEAVKGCRQKQEQEKASKEGLGEKVQLEVKMKEEEKEMMKEEAKAASQLEQGQQQSQTPPPSTVFPEEDQRGRPEHSISSFGSKPRVQSDLEKVAGILPGSDEECCLLTEQRESMDLDTTALQGKVMEEEKLPAAETQAQTQSDFSQSSFENISQNQSNRDISTAAKKEIFIVLTEVYHKFQIPQFREIVSGFLPPKQNNEIKAESPISPANHDERLIDNPASECSQQPKLPELTTALQGRLSHVKKVADQEKLSAIGTEAKILNPELTKVDSQLNPICQRENQDCESAQPTQQNPSHERNVSNSLICPSQDQSFPERHCQYVDKERLDLPLQWESKCHAEAKPEKETVSLPTAVPQETQGDVSPVQSRENQSVSVSHSCYQPEEQSAPESHDCYQTEDPFAPAPLQNREGQQANLISKLQITDLDSVAQKSVLTQVVPLIGRDLLYKMQATISFEKNGQASLTSPGGDVLLCPIQESWRCYNPQVQRMLANPDTSSAGRELLQEVPPEVWAEVDPASLATTAEPIYTPLKDVLDWNTPILTAEEPRIQDKCQPVQNLQAISEIAADMTADANPHVLVGIVIKRGLWYLVLLQPAAEKKFRMFLGMIDQGRIWILDFAALTKPLYGNLKDEIPEQASLTWEPEEKALSSEPTLRTPSIAKTLSPVQPQKNSSERSEASSIAAWTRPK